MVRRDDDECGWSVSFRPSPLLFLLKLPQHHFDPTWWETLRRPDWLQRFLIPHILSALQKEFLFVRETVSWMMAVAAVTSHGFARIGRACPCSPAVRAVG